MQAEDEKRGDWGRSKISVPCQRAAAASCQMSVGPVYIVQCSMVPNTGDGDRMSRSGPQVCASSEVRHDVLGLSRLHNRSLSFDLMPWCGQTWLAGATSLTLGKSHGSFAMVGFEEDQISRSHLFSASSLDDVTSYTSAIVDFGLEI